MNGPCAASAGYWVLQSHGPRQCGKTTLARKVGEPLGYAYITFDDELGKRDFAIYLAKVPTSRDGAFAPLLAFLVWVYYSWFVTLARRWSAGGNQCRMVREGRGGARSDQHHRRIG